MYIAIGIILGAVGFAFFWGFIQARGNPLPIKVTILEIPVDD